jgi:hypothetical protein
VNPPCNRKSAAGNPPPTARAPVLDPTSNTQLATEAALVISQTSAAYYRFAALSDEQLRLSGILADICPDLVRMEQAVGALIEELLRIA